MKTINSDLLPVVKDMPQNDVELDIVTIDDRQFFKYRLNFIINQVAAYTSGVREMKVDVAYNSVSKTFSLLGNKKFSSTTDINNQLLNLSALKRRFINQKDADQKRSIIFKNKVDIFGSSPKISLFRLKQTNFIDLTTIATSYTSETNTSSSNVKISDLVKAPLVSSTSSTGPQVYSKVTLRGKDPAALISQEQSVQDGPRVRTGTMNIRRQSSTIARSFISQLDGENNNNLPNELKSRAVQTLTTDATLPYTFQIPTSAAPPSGKLVVICTLRTAEGDLVQKIDFVINHANKAQQYGIPQVLPESYVQPINSTLAKINVFNKDPRIAGVRIYSRDVPPHQTVSEQMQYENIIDISINRDQKAVTQHVRLKSNTSKLIRMLPILTSGIVLGNFKSISLSRARGVVAGTVVAVSNKSHVTVSLYESPASYAYIQFVRRTVNKRQKNWDPVDHPVKLDLGVATIVDRTVRPGLTYEYAAILQDKYGNTSQAKGTSIVTVQDYTEGTELNIAQVSSSTADGAQTTTFNISVSLAKNSDTTEILNAVKEQGIDEYFASETKNLSGDLNSITKVNVKRVSQDTGEVKDLGIVEPGEFTDTTTENVVYIFEGLLRSQADLFEDTASRKTAQKVYNPKDALQRGNIVSSVLTSTQKLSNPNYTQKFLSKKSLLRGTLSYGNTKVTDTDESGFLQGRLGITSTVAVPRASKTYSIENFDLLVSGSSLRMLSFDVQKNNSNIEKNIDFFIITTQRGGVRSVIGTCHYIGENIRQNFLDDKTQLTTGTIAYIVTPVGYDGVVGNEVSSQLFEVI